jgi:chloramphenicol-sensitive protein RarD
MSPSRQGILYGVLAYFLWGLLPLYFKLLAGSGTLEITVHRYLWAVPTCGLVILATGQAKQLRALLRTPRLVGRLGIAAVALAATSVVYIYAVTTDQVVQTSLGYFINPLASVVLAVVVLGERLRRGQWAAVGIGLSAVLVISVDYGRPPWIALLLACSFGIYGLVKKQVGGNVSAIVGLTVEVLVLFPLAVTGLVVLAATGHETFTRDAPTHGLLLASGGIAIVAPLLPFAAAARRVPLTTIGLLQFLTPILQLVLGAGFFGEPVRFSEWIGFALVWVALTVLSIDAFRARPRSPELATNSPEPVTN